MSEPREGIMADQQGTSEVSWVEESVSVWAARKIDQFFEQHPDTPRLELRDHSILAFFTEPVPDDGHETAEVVTYLHEKTASYVFGKTIADYDRVQLWFVRRPSGEVECFEDDLADERALEAEGDYPGIIALRAQKRSAAVDPHNHSPISEHELAELGKLLHAAEQRLPMPHAS